MTSSSSRARFLSCLALISGMASVVYEVLYMRILTTHLGDMYYIHAAIVGMFLFGIGCGAKIAHRFSGHLPVFEAIIGLYAIAFPEIVKLYVSVMDAAWLGPVVHTLISCCVLLAIPCVAIGCSVPLFSLRLSEADPNGKGFQRIYMLYNGGACASILIADMLLIRWLGISQSTRVMGLLNVCCALLLLRAKRGEPAPDRASGGPRDRSLDLPLIVSFFLASFAAAVFQAYFLKLYYSMFGPDRENFALCTAAILGSIAIGAYRIRAKDISYESTLLNSLKVVAITGVCTPMIGIYTNVPNGLVVLPPLIWKLLVACVLGGWPYAWLAGTIPALVTRDEKVAERSGELLFVSGLANVAGFLGYIFLIHPYLDFFSAPFLAGLLLFFAILIADEGCTLARELFAVCAAALCLGVTVMYPEERAFLGFIAGKEDAIVATFKSASDNLSHINKGPNSHIRYNGEHSIEIRGNARINSAEILSGVLPALAAPRRERAMVLGLGTGITSGSTARLFEHTDVVEINAAAIQLAERIPYANFGISRNPKAHIHHFDGRQYLAHAPSRSYDAIVNSIPTPMYFAAGKIYTREFLQLAKAALKPDGIYCTWVSGVNMTQRGLDSLLATIASEFESCKMFALRAGYFFVACADGSIALKDYSAVAPPPEMSIELGKSIQIPLDEYFREILISEDVLRNFRAGGEILNTDDMPIMEYSLLDLSNWKGGTERDSVRLDPARYNIIGAHDRPDLISRAVVLAQAYPGIFEKLYLDLLMRNEELGKAFKARIDALDRAAAEMDRQLEQ